MNKLIALATIALVPMVSMAQVTNGSFELPDLTPGTSATYPFGSTGIPGWQVIGDSNVQLVTDTYLSGSGYALNAAAGDQWVDLTGDNEGTGKGLSTTFASVVGQVYTLNFALGRLLDYSAASMNVLVDGTPYTFTNSGAGGGGKSMLWDSFSLQFVGDGSTRIDFTGSSANGGNNALIGLDNVAVVPEPGTLALALLGALGLCGALQLRRPS